GRVGGLEQLLADSVQRRPCAGQQRPVRLRLWPRLRGGQGREPQRLIEDLAGEIAPAWKQGGQLVRGVRSLGRVADAELPLPYGRTGAVEDLRHIGDLLAFQQGF